MGKKKKKKKSKLALSHLSEPEHACVIFDTMAQSFPSAMRARNLFFGSAGIARLPECTNYEACNALMIDPFHLIRLRLWRIISRCKIISPGRRGYCPPTTAQSAKKKKEKRIRPKRENQKKSVHAHTHTHAHSNVNVREAMVAVCDLPADQLSLIPPLRAL